MEKFVLQEYIFCRYSQKYVKSNFKIRVFLGANLLYNSLCPPVPPSVSPSLRLSLILFENFIGSYFFYFLGAPTVLPRANRWFKPKHTYTHFQPYDTDTVTLSENWHTYAKSNSKNFLFSIFFRFIASFSSYSYKIYER